MSSRSWNSVLEVVNREHTVVTAIFFSFSLFFLFFSLFLSISLEYSLTRSLPSFPIPFYTFIQTFNNKNKHRKDPNPGYQRSAQGIGAHVHDAFEVGQAANQAGHPQHGR